MIVAKRAAGSAVSVSVLRLGMKRSLVGKGKLSLIEEADVTSSLEAEPVLLRASQNGEMVLIACADGGVDYYLADSSGVSKRQTFRPFDGVPPQQMDFLFGGVSVVLTARDGRQEQWSLFRTDQDGERMFGETKSFPSLGEGKVVFAASQRNRTFLTGAGRELSIRHSTSGAVRWQGEVDIDPALAVLDAKGEHFIVASADGHASRYSIHDPHPEAGWRAFFGKVWYEGGSGPVYQWQSTGGSDDFEPKLSLIPLIFGSLKGTAYALLFSIPVALLAAVFSAAFLPLSVKRVVKPVMEIMSSLPSVVLGFLAGWWLAPILVTRVPSVMVMIVVIPLAALLVGFGWCRLPIGFRNRFAGGSEWLVVLPFLALAGWLGWMLGPVVESVLFVYQDPASGKEIADFRLWWPQVTGTSFEQRNSLVLGFMMGFAVIPVIFTIAEDALSNVPKSLTAAAAALGANRWQVVRTVMLPVASSGIFSALMIGFGRAVGETMIMVMATGNTPVTEWNLFNGMRGGTARGVGRIYPLPYFVPRRDRAFRHDLRHEYLRRGVAPTPAGTQSNCLTNAAREFQIIHIVRDHRTFAQGRTAGLAHGRRPHARRADGARSFSADIHQGHGVVLAGADRSDGGVRRWDERDDRGLHHAGNGAARCEREGSRGDPGVSRQQGSEWRGFQIYRPFEYSQKHAS